MNTPQKIIKTIVALLVSLIVGVVIGSGIGDDETLFFIYLVIWIIVTGKIIYNFWS